MIKNVLIVFVILVILVGGIVWIVRGGPAAIWRGAQEVQNPLDLFLNASSSQTLPPLPWQPTTTYGGIMLGEGGQGGDPNAPVSFTRDSSGPQSDDPRNEIVELSASESLSLPISLAGWSLQSPLSNTRYLIGPQSITLSPGEMLVVYSGGSSWNTHYDGSVWRLYLGLGRDLWRNDHDTIVLLDANGTSVDTFTY